MQGQGQGQGCRVQGAGWSRVQGAECRVQGAGQSAGCRVQGESEGAGSGCRVQVRAILSLKFFRLRAPKLFCERFFWKESSKSLAYKTSRLIVVPLLGVLSIGGFPIQPLEEHGKAYGAKA